MIKRLDRLDIATTDLNDAASIYEKNFGFKVTRAGSDHASVTIGGAEIRLASGALAVDAIKASGEGMFGLWLEAEDLDRVVDALKKAGLATASISKEGGRRILAVDPKLANRVPLFIFDRKG
jgi:predicted enzyme related to lactoylglutathione lyase